MPLRFWHVTHALMRASESVKCLDIETITLFHDGTTGESTLGNTNDTDFLASEIRVVLKVAAGSTDLPRHALEDRSDNSIADLNTLNNSLVVDTFGDRVNPCLRAFTRIAYSVEECHWGHFLCVDGGEAKRNDRY